MGAALKLDGVRKAFGSIVAVDGVSLEIKPGEVFGLLGPNGAGKSTSIAMAVGLLEPDAGSVTVGDLGPPTSAAARASLGVAPQSLAVYDELTARENLCFFGSLYGLAGRALAARAAELLETIGLSDRAHTRVKGFSGGMKRRLNLACALVHAPTLILLDEPTAGVDPQSRNAIFDIVKGLRAAGGTVLYTTHYMEEAQRLCDRVAIIDKGRVLALDTVDHLIGAHGGRSVIRVERAGAEERVETANPLADLARLMPGASSIHIDRPDLETVFLSLTGRSLRD